MQTLIYNATLLNEGTERRASVLIEDDIIKQIIYHDGNEPASMESVLSALPLGGVRRGIDATGMLLMPGVIDDHVHMRDPGLTHKADMKSETQAAAAGGVTSVMDMPNVVPQTTTIALWEEKMAYASQTCCVNYAFYLGATNDNIEEIKAIDPTRIPALKLFMGSSTGGMLVDKEEPLRRIFSECPTLIMTHCEDTDRINERMAEAKKQHGEDPSIEWHAWIRDDEACYLSSALAVKMAKETGARLHLAHITTAKELDLLNHQKEESMNRHIDESTNRRIDISTNRRIEKSMNRHIDESTYRHIEKSKNRKIDESKNRFIDLSDTPMVGSSLENKQITAEVCPQHLFFTDKDYARLGALIKCNPSIKSEQDRDALRKAINDRRIDVIGTDHAPHLLSEKQGGAAKAVSGMPLIQFSLPLMLTLAEEGILSRTRVVELMCHNPALLFGIEKRGFIRPGYKADLVLLKKDDWKVEEKDILSKCGWSPLQGETLKWRVASTWCNGHKVYDGNKVDHAYRGETLRFTPHK